MILWPAPTFLTDQFVLDEHHPFAQMNLAYLRLFSSFLPGADYQIRGSGQAGVLLGTGQSGTSKRGAGLSGTSSTSGFGATTGNDFDLNASRGTVLACTSMNFPWNDATVRCLFGIGTAVTGPQFTIARNGTSWVCGFFDGSESDRATQAYAISDYTQNRPTTIAGVWSGTSLIFYLDGKSLKTINTITPCSVASDAFVVGTNPPATAGWAQEDATVVHYLAIWDHNLGAQSIAHINADPFCFLKARTPFLWSNVPPNLWQLYFSVNGGAFAPVTTGSGGVKAVDAGASADEAAIAVQRLSDPS